MNDQKEKTMKRGMKLIALILSTLLLPVAAQASQWGFAINNPTTAVDPGTGQSNSHERLWPIQ